MCPASLHFWFNVRAQVLRNETTVGAAATFITPRNAERIGFLMGSGGGNINFRPAQWFPGATAETYTLTGTAPFRRVTIFEYGNLITEPWEFTFVSFPNTYTLWELLTPADFKNEVIGK